MRIAFTVPLFMMTLSLGCGVKGRPLPPKTPREIGIGKPQYKGVDQELEESKKKKSRRESY